MSSSFQGIHFPQRSNNNDDFSGLIYTQLYKGYKEQKAAQGLKDKNVDVGGLATEAQRESVVPYLSRISALVDPEVGLKDSVIGKNLKFSVKGIDMSHQITFNSNIQPRKRRIINPPRSIRNTIRNELTISPDTFYEGESTTSGPRQMIGKQRIREMFATKPLFYKKTRFGEVGLQNPAQINKLLAQNPYTPLPRFAGVGEYYSEGAGYDVSRFGVEETYGSFIFSFISYGVVNYLPNLWARCELPPLNNVYLWFIKEYKYISKDEKGGSQKVLSACIRPMTTKTLVPPTEECCLIGQVKQNLNNVRNERCRNLQSIAQILNDPYANPAIAILDEVIIMSSP